MVSDLAPTLAVGAVVVDQRADGPYVVLVRRAQPPMKGQWSLPGGRVRHGELLVDALRREIREECALEVTVETLVEVVELISDEYHFVVMDYRCVRLSGELRAGDDVSDAQWVGVFDLSEYGVSKAVARVVAKAVADERE